MRRTQTTLEEMRILIFSFPLVALTAILALGANARLEASALHQDTRPLPEVVVIWQRMHAKRRARLGANYFTTPLARSILPTTSSAGKSPGAKM